VNYDNPVLRILATTLAPKTPPRPRKPDCSDMRDHFNPFSPCSRTGYEEQNARMQYSIEWEKHVQGKPSYY
jgi:hypothetical protein